MSPRTIVTGNYPHTKVLKDGTVKIDGVDCEFVEVVPVHNAFAHMARELRYDVSEMAIATYLMARDKDIPVTLFPLVVVGKYHHRSIVRLPDGPPIEPKDLVGKNVGVHAYSQTTGLWVRGVLQEEFGIKSSDMTWLTTEAPHVIQYVEPSYVKRGTSSLSAMLHSGEIVAGAMNPTALVAKEGIELIPVIPNAEERQEAWGKRHETIPINHMVTVQTALLKSAPKDVKAIYQGFVEGIETTKSLRSDAPKDRSITHGLNDQLMKAVDLAITYALEQELITKKTSAEEIFADSAVYL